jgi:hypothetical protein
MTTNDDIRNMIAIVEAAFDLKPNAVCSTPVLGAAVIMVAEICRETSDGLDAQDEFLMKFNRIVKEYMEDCGYRDRICVDFE